MNVGGVDRDLTRSPRGTYDPCSSKSPRGAGTPGGMDREGLSSMSNGTLAPGPVTGSIRGRG